MEKEMWPVLVIKHREAKRPDKKFANDAGYDLYNMVEAELIPHCFADIDLGIRIQMPDDLYARIVGRSSTIRKWSLQIQEGVIDPGYTGDLFIGVWNLTNKVIVVPQYTRLAQLLFHNRVDVNFIETNVLKKTSRGENGMGSTGI